MQRLAGNRFLRDLLTPGGVRLDMDDELARVIDGAIAATSEALESLMEHLEGDPSVVDRLEATGVLPRQAAIDLGVTRGGCASQRRKSAPTA